MIHLPDLWKYLQNKIANQTFDHLLQGVIAPTEIKIESGECRTINNIYFVHQPVHALGEVLLSAKAPKLYVSLQNVKKSFCRETLLAKLVSGCFGKSFSLKITSRLVTWQTKLYTALEEYFQIQKYRIGT